VLFHLWNSGSQRLFHTLSDLAHTPDACLFAVAAVFAAACSLQLTQSAERGGQHTGCTGYWLHTVIRLYTITHYSPYYYSKQHVSHRADTALGIF
jgi:hypothetical protein